MALVIPVGYGQVTIPFKHASLVRSAVVTFGVDMPAALTGSQVADQIADRTQTAIAATVDSQVTVGPVEISEGAGAEGNIAWVGSTTWVGTRASDSQPPNCALIARKVTGVGGRRGRGRMFLPWCIAETAVDEVGVINPANVITINGLLEDWLERLGLETNPSPMVLLHATGNTPVPAPSPVTSLSLDTRIGNQRDRLGR